MVSPNATLDVNSRDTSWLKLLANYDNPNYIYVSGSAAIDDVKITSLDPGLNAPILQNSNGTIPRPHIMTEESKGTLNITNSEVGFIGYNDYPFNGFLYANGGNGSKFENNTFHDMWMDSTLMELKIIPYIITHILIISCTVSIHIQEVMI